MNKAFLDVIRSRHSVRGFLPDPVPHETLETIFETAQWAPSNCNTQPWKVCVVSGEACENLRAKYGPTFMQGKASMDFPYSGIYEGVYKERQYGAGAALYSALEIDRKDKASRNKHFLENFTFFNAPHVAFVFIPEQFGIREAADIGMYAQSLMLAMKACDVTCCPQTILSFCADLVREELNVDNSWKLLFGISFGYEDPNSKANRCRTERADLSESVQFYS